MKKQMLKSALIALAGVALMSGSALATFVNVDGTNGEQDLQTILQTKVGLTIDANTDQILTDQYWMPSYGTTSGAWASMLIEIAGNANTNTFGIFDADGDVLDLMVGGANAGDKVSLSWSTSGLYAQYLNYENGALVGSSTLALDAQISMNFGFYLFNGTTYYYSDEAKNGGNDQMVSYYASAGHYIIAFEDQLYNSGSDKDFNDMVLMVESVQPVPEPTTMLLFGAGILGLAGFARRKFNA